MKRPFLILDYNVLAYALREIHKAALEYLAAGKVLGIQIGDKTRSLEQNDAQWPILRRISEGYEWSVNGKRRKMTEEEWKNLLTGSFRNETAQIAESWDGQGICLIGHRTREFGVREFSDWLEFLNAAEAELERRKLEAA